MRFQEIHFCGRWCIFAAGFTIDSCYGDFKRDDFGTAVPFDTEFCFSSVAGQFASADLLVDGCRHRGQVSWN